MRILLVAFVVIVPLLFAYALRASTGDPLSAFLLGLLFVVTALAWFGGRPAPGKLGRP